MSKEQKNFSLLVILLYIMMVIVKVVFDFEISRKSLAVSFLCLILAIILNLFEKLCFKVFRTRLASFFLNGILLLMMRYFIFYENNSVESFKSGSSFAIGLVTITLVFLYLWYRESTHPST
jgi:hypothetical protein